MMKTTVNGLSTPEGYSFYNDILILLTVLIFVLCFPFHANIMLNLMKYSMFFPIHT